jgi:hypothetical protein
LNSICKATKRNGEPCTLPSYGSSSLCWAHSPEIAERRRRGQSGGGRSKPTKELVSIEQRLSGLADDVLEGRTEKGTGAVVSQILNVYLRAIATELKVREVEDLSREVEELRDVLEVRSKERRLG